MKGCSALKDFTEHEEHQTDEQGRKVKAQNRKGNEQFTGPCRGQGIILTEDDNIEDYLKIKTFCCTIDDDYQLVDFKDSTIVQEETKDHKVEFYNKKVVLVDKVAQLLTFPSHEEGKS